MKSYKLQQHSNHKHIKRNASKVTEDYLKYFEELPYRIFPNKWLRHNNKNIRKIKLFEN
jgi:hypothetical protein